MATLEDKILGEKAENYCDSDEGEHPEDRDDNGTEDAAGPSSSKLTFIPPGTEVPPTSASKWGGTSQNTGPKGVLRDWELYKLHEEQLRKEKDAELIRMVKESSLSCRTDAEDQEAKEAIEKLREEIESNDMEELDELLNDKVLEKFIQQRMSQMAQLQTDSPKFGTGLVEIQSGEEFLKIVDQSGGRIAVVIHIYDEKLPECSTMNSCLSSLSDLYPHVQFCKIRADVVGVSMAFKTKGIPALLVYKGGNLIGNFVQLKEEFGTEFYHGDVENFLIENGMIEDRNNIPKMIAAAKARVGS